MQDLRIASFLKSRNASLRDWTDWRWQMRYRIRTPEQLREWIDLSVEDELGLATTVSRYEWTVTPYYASLMDRRDATCPIRRQAVPSNAEVTPHSAVHVDPVGDRTYRVTNRVIHKYPDRVVILVTSQCPVLCRFCTRKHHTTAIGSTYFRDAEADSWDPDFDYLRRTTAIRDVLLTGGDPLSYDDRRLDEILSRLRAIPHIEIVRIGTRYPVLLPQRITESLCSVLARYHPVWINTHFNHPAELTPDAIQACDMLLRHGVPVGNQSVLLRGVNDDLETMRALCHGLVRARIRPYYLYHCDAVEGVGHFQTSIAKGREIVRGLNGFTTGFAVPQYVLTTDKGKILLAEDNVIELLPDGSATLRTYAGDIVRVAPARAE